MKHRFTITFVLLALMLACMACGKGEKKPLTAADHAGLAEDEQIFLEMDYPDYTGSEEWIYAILSNDADQEISFGIPELEVLKDSTWYTIPEKDGVSHTAELPFLMAGDRGSVAVLLTNFAYDFPLGQYRIALPYTFGDYTADKGWDHLATAEFSVVKKAKRTDFRPFVEQIYEPDKALKGGVAAFSNGQFQGQDIIETFFYKALSGVPCEMRIVYPELDLCEHYIYNKGCYTIQSYENQAVTTHCYSYLYMDPVTGDLTFSNYADPVQAEADGFIVSEPEDIYALGEVSEETREDVERVFLENRMDSAVMRVYLFEPERNIVLVKTDDGYMIGHNADGSGELFEIEEQPVSIRAIYKTAAVVQFKTADGSLDSRIYDLEKGGFE